MYLYRQWWCTWTDRNMPLTCYCCCGGELKWVQQKNNIIVLFAAVVLFGFGLIWFGIITHMTSHKLWWVSFSLHVMHPEAVLKERRERWRWMCCSMEMSDIRFMYLYVTDCVWRWVAAAIRVPRAEFPSTPAFPPSSSPSGSTPLSAPSPSAPLLEGTRSPASLAPDLILPWL